LQKLEGLYGKMNQLLGLSIASFAITWLSVTLSKHYLQRYLLDIPNERSSHSQPTPRGGGLSFLVAFALTAAIAQFCGSSFISLEQSLLWLSLIPLALISAIDDWRGVSAAVRYGVQFAVSTFVVTQCGAFLFPGLSQLGLTGDILATLLTIIGMTALINFCNFMDGLDGLVAGVSAVQLGFLALWFDQPLLWLLVAALAGFLYWNWSPAKIFMGDVGSTFLGAAVALALLYPKSDLASAWSALAIVLPLVGDAIYTLSRRLLHGENIFQAHRTHLYQRLQQAGWSHAQVASTYIALTLLVASSITFWGLWGAGLSLMGAIAAILGGELYLKCGKQAPAVSCSAFKL
jgi:Fuc2NAc and GlcNAc transferase